MKREEQLFDKKVPSRLKKTQQWFASVIVRPIDEDSRMNPISPSGELMQEEAFDYIVPSPSLRPAQRIELYNQQYWWRLLGVLQDAFPLVTRLFGFHDFNIQIGKPYLDKYPPKTWTLNVLGDQLPQWIEEEYHANDKQLILDAAQLDCALNQAFFAKHITPVNAADLAEGVDQILQRRLRLQPHVFLFKWRYDLFSFRKEMLKEDVEHWIHQDFPKLVQDRAYYFISYRNHMNDVHWEELSPAAFQFLNRFSKGATIEEVCEWLEQQDEDMYTEASNKLHLWFQEWIYRQWLYFDEQS